MVPLLEMWIVASSIELLILLISLSEGLINSLFRIL